ncbi:SusD/RagB family nutrient-binding outer membrane lipoprotein [Hymenobacter sp. H14-R3]|uniref:SusD/RagB family nutrient-binding outer membrane lipoprotein n=1 Tax=Hymenobacter sp. H14-R3 TaxID=3046308 RepID=UPI0024BAF263|nr:SusD/RagB family nutrient-binding outer membrane lipoprotein [Hymenobacter sp. H14-R3]MDJ0363968.1 SusD/RagB family nutrient-binding outer membrane lipoprotein [Hymenobacter sp. H14-R3]
MNPSIPTTTRLRYAALALAGWAATSCSPNSFLDVNASPNNPTVVQPTVQLPTITVGTAFLVGNTLGRDGDLFVQHYAGIANQPFTEDRYAISGNYDNEWRTDLYGNNLNGAQTLIASTQASSPAYAGIGKLIKAYNFALATDMWGDVPYSQALQGLGAIHPAFDKQQDIYQGATGIQSLFDLVREGLADLDKPSVLTPSGTDDFVYKGDLSKWRKMGNMLLLKFACTVSRKDPALAAKVIKEVLDKPGSDPKVLGSAAIATNGEDFAVPFGTAVGNTNPFYSYNITNRPNDQMASTRFLDSLTAYNDPRLPKYFTTTAANAAPTHTTPYGKFTGFENGSNATAPVRANRSVYNTYLLGAVGEAPVRLLTNFQRCFILAEAAIRLKTAGDANALYQEGITRSMEATGLSTADITAYFTANPAIVTLRGTDEHKLDQILRQKWMAWVGNGYEAWNDYRRTGRPRLQPALNVSFTPNIPQRLLYPPSEVAANGDNMPKVLIDQAVWWAAN